MLLQQRSFIWGTGPCWGWSSPHLLQEHPSLAQQVPHAMYSFPKTLTEHLLREGFHRDGKVTKKSTFNHLAGKQIGVEDKKSSLTKHQPVPCVSDGVKGFTPSVVTAPSLRIVLGSGVCGPRCTCPSGCSWGLMDVWPIADAPWSVHFPETPLLKAHQSFQPHVLTYSSCHIRPRVSWQLQLLWGYVWLKNICGNKIKVYMHPIEKGPEMHKRWAWSHLKGEHGDSKWGELPPCSKLLPSFQLGTKFKHSVRLRGCASIAKMHERFLPPCCKFTPWSALTFNGQQFL